MPDPTYIKIAALVGGAVLLLWPLFPKAVAAIKGLAPAPKKTGLIEATEALGLVRAYLDGDEDVEPAIEELAIAIVRKGLS